MRDSWATPQQITDLLPVVDLDPCSNPQSTVQARMTYSLERGEDGLGLPWVGSVFVNGPYSNLLPWAIKFRAECAKGKVTWAGFLVNADHSTAWWRQLTEVLDLRLDFYSRIRFVPPPGVRPSSNTRPQVLLMDRAFLRRCNSGLLSLGVLWEIRREP